MQVMDKAALPMLTLTNTLIQVGVNWPCMQGCRSNTGCQSIQSTLRSFP